MRSKNVRIMLVLLVVAFCYTFVCGNGGCEPTGSGAFVEGAHKDIVSWGNDLADTVDEAADVAGIPRCLSCEIFESITD